MPTYTVRTIETITRVYAVAAQSEEDAKARVKAARKLPAPFHEEASGETPDFVLKVVD